MTRIDKNDDAAREARNRFVVLAAWLLIGAFVIAVITAAIAFHLWLH